MDEKREEEYLKMLCLKGTKKILEFMDKNKEAQYKQMKQFASTYTLNERMRGLLEYDLVQHHLVREDVRREWYEFTGKGREVLTHLRELVAIVDE